MTYETEAFIRSYIEFSVNITAQKITLSIIALPCSEMLHAKSEG